MQHLNNEFFKAIEDYVNQYCELNSGVSPSVREIAEGIGLSKSTVSKYLNIMSEQGLVRLGGHRGVSTKMRQSESLRVPILGSVACGIPKFAEENIEEYIALPSGVFGRGELFVLYAKGDSMINAGIDDGDMVVVRRQSVAEYNQIVVALVGDEATLKRFRPQPDCVYLHPENPNYEDIIVDSCIIQGVAVKVLKELR